MSKILRGCLLFKNVGEVTNLVHYPHLFLKLESVRIRTFIDKTIAKVPRIR